MRLNCWIIVGCIAIVVTNTPASAQTNEELFEQFEWQIATPGARTNAMGGASVASIDDASSAVINPAGITAAGPAQLSFDFRSANLRTRHLAASDSLLTGALARQSETSRDLSWINAVVPLAGGRAALAFTRYEFLDYRSAFHLAPRLLPGLSARGPSAVDSTVDVGAVSYAASAAIALRERVRLGLTVSIDRLRASVLNTRHDIAPGTARTDPREIDVMTNQSSIDGSDIAASLIAGAQYAPFPWLSLGATFAKGPSFHVLEDFRTNADRTNFRTNEPADVSFSAPVSLNVPDRLTAGLAVRPSQRLLLALDAAHIGYSSLARDLTPIIGHDLVTSRDFRIADATEIRTGGEVNVGSPRTPLFIRAGAFTNHDHSLRYVGNVQPTADVTAGQAARINVYQRSVFNLGRHDTDIIGTLGAQLPIFAHAKLDAAYVWKRAFIASVAAHF